MSGRRVLSEIEKRQIKERRLTQERALSPTSNFDVRVADETDDRGQPIVVVNRFTTTEKPENWKPE